MPQITDLASKRWEQRIAKILKQDDDIENQNTDSDGLNYPYEYMLSAETEKINSLNNENVDSLLWEIQALKESNKEKKNKLEQLEKDIVNFDASEIYLKEVESVKSDLIKRIQ